MGAPSQRTRVRGGGGGAAALPLSTLETAGPGVAQIGSKDPSPETTEKGRWVMWVPGVCTDQGLGAPAFLRRGEAEDPEVPSWEGVRQRTQNRLLWA